MHESTTERNAPWAWVTWVTKLLSGESSCLWSAWFKAHYDHAKHEGDGEFDSVAWKMDHTALLNKTILRYTQDGYVTTTEHQNAFHIQGKTGGTIAGKPDLIAVKDNRSGFIVDAKTGKPKASDKVQVLIYMWAVPRFFAKHRSIKFDGRIVYKTGESVVLADEMNEAFRGNLFGMLSTIFGVTKPACGRAVGMGVFQDKSGVDREQVWQSVLNKGDYGGAFPPPAFKPYGDYVFGRMMKLGMEYDKDSITIKDTEPQADYQSWCRVYPSYKALIEAAIKSVSLLQ